MFVPARAALALVLSAVALAVAPALALAATPPVVNAPTAKSLLASMPVFTWTLGPAGELVNTISIRPTVSGANEEAQTVRGLAGVLTATSIGTLDAGTYTWAAGWATAPGVRPYESGATAEQRFTVPPRVTKAMITRFDQSPNRVESSITGTYDTNIPRVNVTCKVFNGRAVVATKVLVREDANSFGQGSQFRCYVMVPEALDGVRLRVEATVAFGRTKAVTSKVFVAK